MTPPARKLLIFNHDVRIEMTKKSLCLTIFVGFFTNLHIGLLSTWSLFGKAFIDEYNWSNLFASLPYSVAVIFYALSTFCAGYVLRKLPAQILLLFASFFIAVGLIGVSITSNPLLVILSFGIFVGCGIGFAYMSVLDIVMKRIPKDKRGIVSGFVLSGFALSSTYLAPLANFLIKTKGITNAFRLLALIIGSVLLLCSLLTNKIFNCTDGAIQKKSTNARSFYEKLIRSNKFWQMFLIYFAGSLATVQLTGHISNIVFIHTGVKNATMFIGIFAVANFLGRIFAGITSDNLPYEYILSTLFFVNAINMVAFPLYSSGLIIIVGFVIAAITGGATIVCVPQIIVDEFCIADSSEIFGFVSLASGIAGFLGPVLTGAIVDYFGTYTLAYVFCGMVMIVASIISLNKVSINNKKQN